MQSPQRAPSNEGETGASRALDIDVLCEVFGFPRRKVFYVEPEQDPEWPMFIPSGKSRRTHMLDAQPVPHFSSNIGYAWQVFEKALTEHGAASISADMEDWGRGAFFGDGPEKAVTVSVGLGPAWYVTAPVCEAICRAALLATRGTP